MEEERENVVQLVHSKQGVNSFKDGNYYTKSSYCLSGIMVSQFYDSYDKAHI